MSSAPAGRILVIEDEPDLREAYRFVLEHEGYHVVCAADGTQGLAELHALAPDLVLLDMLMPKLDGLGFLRGSHLREDYPSTKVIVLSNLTDHARIDEMRRFGVDRHVLKADLDPRTLAEVVARTLKERG